METTEKVVEAYVRYVRGWFTIPNIKCKGQYEVDLLAVDVSSTRLKRYHIESGVSISGGFSKLTNKPFSPTDLKIRVRQASQRRTLGYFIDRKFSQPEVLEAIGKYGFTDSNYAKVIVTWGIEDAVENAADKQGVLLWHFPDLLREIAETMGKTRIYFTDDTLRTLQLMAMATRT